MPDSHITHVVVPGTFDPITLGHLDVIKRAARISERVTVAVAASRTKHGVGTAFTLEERIALAKRALAEAGAPDTIDVKPLEGLLVDFCRAEGAQAVVKGLRAATDFEYELQQADLNARMAPFMESIFVMSSPEYGFVSSSIVREVASLGGDVSMLVPPCVTEALREHYRA
jgi:pantetheine-phosphate adenylyltransferase